MVLRGDNVFEVKWPIRLVVLVQAAGLAALARTFPHLLPQRRRHAALASFFR